MTDIYHWQLCKFTDYDPEYLMNYFSRFNLSNTPDGSVRGPNSVQ